MTRATIASIPTLMRACDGAILPTMRSCSAGWSTRPQDKICEPDHRVRGDLVHIAPHDRLSCEITLTPDSVAEYARAAGNRNPVHVDSAFAARTRYRRLIASGTETTALLLGLPATHFSKDTSMVGLEYWVKF